VKGTVPASSFSCSADRQERRPGLPACRRPDRSRSTFRKTACCSKRAYWPANRPFPTKVRTTNLGPFGEVIRATGPMAKANPFRFSTKYQDDETDLLYYGYRYYNASTGRWISRDPAEEDGGSNLYGAMDNDPTDEVDPLGLKSSDPTGLPSSATGCCTQEKIAAGERTLNRSYNRAVLALSSAGLKPAFPGYGGATCKNSSSDVISYLSPTPPCWRCYLDLRSVSSAQKDPEGKDQDHQVVICAAYSATGTLVKEIIFDWWGDTPSGLHQPIGNVPQQSGGSPGAFRRKYPFQRRIGVSPFFTNCDGTHPYRGSAPRPCLACSTGK